MAKSHFFLFLFHMLLSACAGGHLKFANGWEIMNNTWCMVKPSTSEVVLSNNIDYACNMLGDCKMIQPGGSCYDPNNLFNHASAVMNQYYAINGRNPWNCDFVGSGIIVTSDPSYGSCQYA
ncbi:hypothetical protein Fmac_004962 [Flemingia macrophylla]|uniref:X8 domain-containing protein n=1 Tax=Flemingia macrophylla TaxID=520843 RepID=A0ABD1N6E8_9FABA